MIRVRFRDRVRVGQGRVSVVVSSGKLNAYLINRHLAVGHAVVQ